MTVFACGFRRSATLFAALVTSGIFVASAQAPVYNPALKARLDSIGERDQRYRVLLDNLSPPLSDSLSKVYGIPADSLYSRLMQLQAAIDTAVLAAVEDIILKNGYPGKTQVGMQSNEVAFYVIRHSSKIPLYFPLLQNAASHGEIRADLVAMMEDRLLVAEEKEQKYGTQLWGNAVKDSITGVTKPVFYFNPVADEAHVNERREKAGFVTTIEQYAEEMNIPHRIRRPWWWKD